MGADAFISAAPGKDVGEAFANARADAAYWNGHGGYTGTVAEKGSWIVIQREPVEQKEALEMAEKLLADDDQRVTDKWGPAGAIAMKDGKWLFFGWASS